MKLVLVASVIGDTENHFAIVNGVPCDNSGLHQVEDVFKKNASEYFHVGKEHCHVEVANATSVTVNAVIEAVNRATGYHKDMDKKCFEFLVDAVKSCEAEQFKNELYSRLGAIAAMI